MSGASRSRLAVCIPVYNGEDYLGECLDSILAQTIRPDEIIIVDDGSQDGSAQLIARYLEIEPRIRYVRNEANLGLVGNWNHCFELATSEWIKFVFQDDLLLPSCLEDMLAFSDGPEDLVACRRDILFETPPSEAHRRFYAENQILIDRIFSEKSVLSSRECMALALSEFGHNLVGEPSSVMIRRRCFERYGAFREGLVMSCDLEYWIRIGIHTGIRFIGKTLSRFRVHPGATSADNLGRRAFRMHSLDNLLLLRDFVREPIYAPLRAYATSVTPPCRLKASMDERRNAVFSAARWAEKRPVDPDPSLRRELDLVYRVAPDLRVGPLEHLAWRIRRRVRSFAGVNGDRT